MKKFLVCLLAVCMLAFGAVAFTACEGENAVDVYMPDGAPALSMAEMLHENTDFSDTLSDDSAYTEGASYNVVAATTIQTYVTGDEPQAELAVIPVNAAAQLLGDGETYQMLATLTHGNIYFLSAKYPAVRLTVSNLSALVGKKVGCIQLSNVVGLTLRAVLYANNVPYVIKEDSAAEADPEVVNLFNISDPANEITPAANFDYMVAAEPAVSAKVKATAGNTAGAQLIVVGDLQELYGQGGYPQAVLVAKKSFIEAEPAFIAAFTAAVAESCEWVNAADVDIASVVAAVSSHLAEDATPSFNANNLTAEVIGNCAIEYVSAADSREEVTAFLAKLGNVGANLSVEDDFFYTVE